MTVVINGTTGITNPNSMTIGNGGGNIASNTAVGASALAANTTGSGNTASGYSAMPLNGAGANNTSFGVYSLTNATTADGNTAVGAYAATALTTRGSVTAIGAGAMRLATNASDACTAIGYNALYNNNGAYNTAVGFGCLVANTTGASNTAGGLNAMQANTTGAQNTAWGHDALYSNIGGSSNVAIGRSAMLYNTSGVENVAVGYYALASGSTQTGSYNTAVGTQALTQNTSGIDNTAVGWNALYANTTGSYNTSVGFQSGISITAGTGNALFGYYAGRGITGNNNVCLGYGAGYYSVNYQGSNSILIGTNTDANGTADSNELVIGYGAKGKGSNTGFISMGSISIYQGNNSGSWATTSDQRIKKNIIDVANGLDVITALRPVEFDYKEDDTHDIGFIAQEYQQVLPDQIVKHAPNDAEKEWIEDGEVLGIQPNLVPYLVKAIQELKAELDAAKADIATLKAA